MLEPSPTSKLDIILNVKMCAHYDESCCKFKKILKISASIENEQGEG